MNKYYEFICIDVELQIKLIPSMYRNIHLMCTQLNECWHNLLKKNWHSCFSFILRNSRSASKPSCNLITCCLHLAGAFARKLVDFIWLSVNRIWWNYIWACFSALFYCFFKSHFRSKLNTYFLFMVWLLWYMNVLVLV